MSRLKLFILLLSCLSQIASASDELRAPDPADNKLYSQCASGLVEIYSRFNSHKDELPGKVQQRLISLLLAAEIDSQFKHYPYCVNKLDRARLFIEQSLNARVTGE